MNAPLLTPRPDLATLILRLGLAAIFIPHGWIKLDVGLYSTEELVAGVSRTTQTLVGAAELVCGLMMLGGLGSRLAAVVLMVIQVAAVLIVSGDQLPVVVRSSTRRAEYLSVGPEYNLVLGLMCLAVLVLGSGYYSLDRLLMGKWRTRPTTVVPPRAAPAAS